MLKDLFEYFKNHNRPETVEVGADIYSTSQLRKLNVERGIAALSLRSLSGLVDYVKSDFDTTREFMVHVQSPTAVRLYDALNADNERREYMSSDALLPRISFDSFMDRENFAIQMQSNFIQDAETTKVLKFIASVSEENSKETRDNGVSQSVVAKTGIATVAEAEVPNPVYLRPFRTFVEVPQPESAFVLRMKEGPRVALFEADGAAWELTAMSNIEDYLREALTDEIDSGKVIIVA